MGFCPPGHIPSKWQNMSVYFGHGTMTCPSSVHLCPPSTWHLSCPICGVSLLHRAMGVSTPHSLTTMEQGILMVGDSPQQINSDRYSLIRQEELADMRMVSTWAIAGGFWEGE